LPLADHLDTSSGSTGATADRGSDVVGFGIAPLAFGGNDPRLGPFLLAADESAAEERLADLIRVTAAPIVSGVVARRLRFGREERQDSADVRSDISLRLITSLQSLRVNADAEPIADFGRYVAVTSFHACHDYLRRRYPVRWRLKNRLRYLLTHDPQFVVTHDPEQGPMCAFSAARSPARGWPPRPNTATTDLAGRVAGALAGGGEPMSLDRLVDLIGDAADADPAEPLRPGEHAPDPIEQVQERGPGIGATLEARDFLHHLWREILLLPRRQRTALILGLRAADGGDALALLTVVGIATIGQIAGAVGIPADEFAHLWPDLPFEDERIAPLVGATRQQVVNLRKSARARLGRRMKGR
jgi:hypothetical protein